MTFVLLAFLCLAAATVGAADHAGADSKDTIIVRSTDTATIRIEEPMVLALATPEKSIPSIPSLLPVAAPHDSTPFASPAPARFFTINEVMAKRGTSKLSNSSNQFASINPPDTVKDASTNTPPETAPSNEPFGLFTFIAPDGQLWSKWRKVDADFRAFEPTLTRCLADAKDCSPAAARFRAIVVEAREHKGRAQLDLVNTRVNNAIRYKSDMEQWGVADRWSTPLDTSGAGSFNTGFGDCEDFAIAKYAVLRAAGVPANQLRVMLVHDKMARMDHAVLTARENGHWFVLDNRWMGLVEDTEARQFAPLFALDDHGVKLLAAPYAANIFAKSKTANSDTRIFVPGGAEVAL